MLVDSHCHLDIVDDIDGAIERAAKAGVKAIVTSGVDIKSNRAALELAKKYSLVKASLGLYPTQVLALSDKEIDAEIDFIRQHKDDCIIVGEIGLDYKELEEKEGQQEMFRRFISLAGELGKPLIVHSRKAEADAISILEEMRAAKVIMHCFSGKKQLIRRCIDDKYMFSIPANIVFSEHFQNLVKMCPLNQLLTETDSPLLSPFKGRPNEPRFVIESVKKIAEIKGLDVEETKRIIYSNWQNLTC